MKNKDDEKKQDDQKLDPSLNLKKTPKDNPKVDPSLKAKEVPKEKKESFDDVFAQIVKEEQKLEGKRDVKSKKLIREFGKQRAQAEEAEAQKKRVQKKAQKKKSKSVDKSAKSQTKKEKKLKYKLDLDELAKKNKQEEQEEQEIKKEKLSKRAKHYFFGVGRELLRISYLTPKELKSDSYIIFAVTFFFVAFLFLVDVIFIILRAIGLI